MPTHAILMPLKATSECPPRDWVNRYTSSFGASTTTKLYIGVDEDDVLWETSHREEAKARVEAARGARGHVREERSTSALRASVHPLPSALCHA